MKGKLNEKAILDLLWGFQPSSVVIAGAELDVFSILHAKPMVAARLARQIKGDLRATIVLLDALTAIRLLEKGSGSDPVYRVPKTVAEVLTETGSQNMLGMARHLGNCLRSWGQLASVVLRGKPATRRPSVRGAGGDLVSFIRAMHEISEPMAMPLVGSLGPLKFTHLLDLGGASGTWTIPFLRLNPEACATIFDQPGVIPMARRLMKKAGLARRVRLVAGSFYSDALPTGSDLAWVSAIVHQNSRAQNRAMFSKVFSALTPGGRILIRDIVMDSSRTRPAGGALFAVNMLVATPKGGTFTFGELHEDLSSAGFVKVKYLRRGEWMDSVVCATKPRPCRPPKPPRRKGGGVRICNPLKTEKHAEPAPGARRERPRGQAKGNDTLCYNPECHNATLIPVSHGEVLAEVVVLSSARNAAGDIWWRTDPVESPH